jgi:ribose 5-phosphate isomerase A
LTGGAQNYKRQAAARALELVEPGMVLGLGTGSTAAEFVHLLGQRMKQERLDLRCVATSLHIGRVAEQAGIAIADFSGIAEVDLTVDGADEIDPQLNLIKGGGGALLREKIVAQASLREIIVADETKMSPALGTRHAIPVEVVAFGWQSHVRFLGDLGARVTLRRRSDGTIFRTDQNNMLLDADFGPIGDPPRLAAALKARAGIVEHGLFLELASDVIVAGKGSLRHLVRG